MAVIYSSSTLSTGKGWHGRLRFALSLSLLSTDAEGAKDKVLWVIV